MKETLMIYDENGYFNEFRARVLSCRPAERGGYEVILSQTAFFPEQGGQVGDQGFLDGVRVRDTQIEDGLVIHYCEKPLAEGSVVHGAYDRDRRFDLMQNHTGEHILSGIICHSHSCNNVGFRLSEENCTVDYDCFLDEEDLRKAELQANQAIWADKQVIVDYPNDRELARLDYRCKKELTGRIRIVTIPGIDVCACCAPHVSRTGEVGMLKIISCEKHKSGVRLYIASGQRAYRLMREIMEITDSLVHALSLPKEKLPQRIADMNAEIYRLTGQLSAVKISLMKQQLQAAEGPLALFFVEDGLEKDVREVINEHLSHHEESLCAGFTGNDASGYRCVMASRNTDMKQLAEQLRQRLAFQGGGSRQMIQGSVRNSRQEIETVLNEMISQNGL
ncbi:MAG: hypothetical protein IJM79_06030 [Erysipelotrichaceae bacterium]|nr:hypothetical protein [Erysipelotrichaceae bacterium]